MALHRPTLLTSVQECQTYQVAHLCVLLLIISSSFRLESLSLATVHFRWPVPPLGTFWVTISSWQHPWTMNNFHDRSMFSVKITTWSLFGAVSKALTTSKCMFYNKDQRDPNSLLILLYARYSSIVKDIFYQFPFFSTINEARLIVAHWMCTSRWRMTGRKRAQESLVKFVYVIVAKSKECILDYSFPLICFFFGF